MMSKTQPANSQTLAAGKKELRMPTPKVVMRKSKPTRTRVRETGSGSFGSNGGRANGG
jgi:hypothetical protein